MTDSTCTVPGCERQRKNRDWCHKHYEALRSSGELPPKSCKGCGRPCPGPRLYCSDVCKPRCAVDACGDQAKTRGWCTFHFTRWKLTGDPASPITTERYTMGQGCAFDQCVNPARKVGYCSGHYSQMKAGAELRPLTPKSKATICAFCGGPSGVRKGYNRVCSSRCSVMFKRHGAPLPETFQCRLCLDHFPFETQGQRRKKFNTKTCVPCQRNSMKHGYSAKQLAKRDGTDCKLCGVPVDMSLRHPNLMRGSVDHIIPSSLGGSNEPDNVQLAHLHCNIKKNNHVEVPMAS